MQGALETQLGSSQGVPVCRVVARGAGSMDFRRCAVTQNLTFRRALCSTDPLPSPLEILGTGAPRLPFALGPASYAAGPGNQGAFLYSTCIGSVIFSLPNDSSPLTTWRTCDFSRVQLRMD